MSVPVGKQCATLCHTFLNAQRWSGLRSQGTQESGFDILCPSKSRRGLGSCPATHITPQPSHLIFECSLSKTSRPRVFKMDHVPVPRGGLEPIKVPFLAARQFDSGDFESFPSRAGFPPVEDQEAWQEMTADEVASFVQTWLYFGVIATFLEQTINQAHFVVKDASASPASPGHREKSLVSSLPLISLLDEWSTSTAI